MNIDKLISIINKDDIKILFDNSDKLIFHLKELDNLIGMSKIKQDIVRKIEYYIIEESKDRGKGLKGTKIHFIMLGNPGTGKTTVCKIIAEIYNAIGFLKKGKNKNQKIKNINELQNEVILVSEEEKKEQRKLLNELFKLYAKLEDVSNLIDNGRRTLLSSNIEKSLKENITNNISLALTSLNQNKVIFDALRERFISKAKKNISINIDPQSDILPNENIEEESSNFVILRRSDMVGEYVGLTEKKTEKALLSGLGGVIFIDEFYTICVEKLGHSDSDGQKILDRINSFIDQYEGNVCFAFGGYLKDINNQIFAKQQGLSSRIVDKFIIEDYKSNELAKIYIMKMIKLGFDKSKLEKYEKDIGMIIDKNIDIVNGNGRSMETLADNTKCILTNKNFDNIINKKKDDVMFNINIFEEAIKNLRDKIF